MIYPSSSLQQTPDTQQRMRKSGSCAATTSSFLLFFTQTCVSHEFECYAVTAWTAGWQNTEKNKVWCPCVVSPNMAPPMLLTWQLKLPVFEWQLQQPHSPFILSLLWPVFWRWTCEKSFQITGTMLEEANEETLALIMKLDDIMNCGEDFDSFKTTLSSIAPKVVRHISQVKLISAISWRFALHSPGGWNKLRK